LVQFTVSDGGHVFENEVYALIEVMKLVLELRSPASGCIFHLRCAGAILESGVLIARLQMDDPQQCPALTLFTGQLNPVHSMPSGLYQHDHGPALSLSSGVASDEFSLGTEAQASPLPALNSDSPSTGNLEVMPLETTDAASAVLTPSMPDEAGQHHVFHRCFSELEEVLAGYALPEPFFTPWLNTKLDELFQCLRCPRLPLLELEEAVAQLSGRLPVAVEQSLCALTASYADEVTSMLSNFPADKIVRLVEGHVASRRLESASEPNITEASIASFQQTIKRLIDLADRYRGGLRGHAARAITNLLLAYLAVEQHYQHGQFDRCVNLLLTRHKAAAASSSGRFDDASSGRKAADMLPPISWTPPESVQRFADPTSVTDVVSVHFSHHQLAAKNALIVGLIERFTKQRDLTPTRDLIDSLTALTQLGMAANSKVALAARKYLISAQSPPYELRRNQASINSITLAVQSLNPPTYFALVESIILSAINNYNEHFPMENLQRLITCETSVYDVLLDFLYHPNPLVVSAALEVYVRRSYITYELTGVQHFELPTAVSCIFFKFLLPQASMHLNLWRHYLSSLRHPPGGSAKSLTALAASEMSMESEDSESSELDWFLAGDCASMCQTSLEHSDAPGGQENTTMSTPSSDASLVSRAHCQKAGSTVSFSDLGTSTPGLSSFPSLISRLQRKLKNIELEKRAGGRRQNSFSSNQTCRAATCGTMPSESFVSFQDPPFHTPSTNDVPMNILNIALQSTGLTTAVSSCPSPLEDEVNEETEVQLLEEFCQANSRLLQSVGIRRITFMIVMPRKFPVFFTFRARDNFREDRVYRHLEPALAFQMEINRLRNYNLELIPVLNRRMHVYLGQAKVLPFFSVSRFWPLRTCPCAHFNCPDTFNLANWPHNSISQGQGAVDFRFFVRSMIRHADLVSKAASFEYLRSEAERTLLEAMDALEVAFTHPKASFTTGNHIFFNFAPTLLLEDMNQLQLTVRRTIVRYATRLVKLRVNHAELKMVVRLRKNGPRIPIRLFIANEQGYSLKLEVYREAPNLVTGAVHLVSFGSHIGRLHGALADMPYETKDFLQLKRFQAQKFNSAYVYDYPALFGQVLRDAWQTYRPSTVYFTLENEDGESQTQKSAFTATQEKSVNTEMPGRPFSDYILECTELCLDDSGQLVPVNRVAGLNKVGIVVWKMIMKTLEFPGGRPVIVIANDVTHKAGSFGPAEDLMFYRASELARRLGIPRVFIAANTGARIRLAEEVKAVYKVAWVDDANPTKGFRYLYLTESDYVKLDAMKSVNCELVEENGERRHKIIDVIGRDFDISVENLRGSALIAGETAAAYEECFTISVVPSRTIGIGAYLVRLGQRVIQVENSHIILTGAMALNKLLGREVYTSNSQLGGVQVMANNGVCHSVVPDEYAALQHVIKWLSFVPYERGGRLPILRIPLPLGILSHVSSPSTLTLTAPSQPESNSDGDLSSVESLALRFDPIDRPVEYVPTRDRPSDDPRWMFTGVMSGQLQTPASSSSATSTPPGGGTQKAKANEETTPLSQAAAAAGGGCGRWLSGFFDWGTWEESLAAWAAGVVVGRARLGGIPCGIISPETRVSISRVPADPANPASEAQTISQAGQVWYPDSSYKTAQAINDFNREGLPLFIFANWRGFSGGLKDMYDQVLKFGAMIVESLRTYSSPVFIYLPPHAELRGGAWVVIDPAINPDNIELFCSPDTCRGGVLEPEGTVEIKYRTADLLATMNRLDDECHQLCEEIKARNTGRQKLLQPQQSSVCAPGLCNATMTTTTTSASSSTLKSLQERLAARQHLLLPIYQQVSFPLVCIRDLAFVFNRRIVQMPCLPFLLSILNCRAPMVLVAHRFADLHDTPGRMTARGLVHGTVEWRSSRAFFFARLSRRLLELEAVRLLRQAQNPLNTADSFAVIPADREIEEGETEMEVSEKVRGSHRDRGKVPTRLWSRVVGSRLRTLSDCESPSARRSVEVLGLPRSELRDLTHSTELVPEPDSMLLSDAERACYLIAQIGAQRSASVRRDLTRLRRWFIQDHLSKDSPESCLIFPSVSACSKVVRDSVSPVFSLPDVQSSSSSSSDLSEAVRAWETSDATVAQWLAFQLDHSELYRLLDNFNAPVLMDGCWTLVAASEAETGDAAVTASIPARQPPKSSLMSRLQEISKQQMISHIRRYVYLSDVRWKSCLIYIYILCECIFQHCLTRIGSFSSQIH
uniref:Ras-GEF domain-containing protein n=1 Tax=Schistocephalus solidus TaxID=70667 RepID=A0A183SYC7_SCHSO